MSTIGTSETGYPASAERLPTDTPTIVIRPPTGWIPLDLNELIRYRELLWFFFLRDIKSRVKQTALGPLWIILPPLVGTGIFSILFGIIAGLSSGDIPYPVFVFSGMLVWRLFVNAMDKTSNCLMANSSIFTKVYLPRLLMPISATLAGLLDFLIHFLILIIILVFCHYFGFEIPLTWAILAFPFFILLSMMMGMTVGLWLAALGVRYRDVRMLATLIIQPWTWITPVAYSSIEIFTIEGISETYRPLVEIAYKMNPIWLVVEGFRWSILGQDIGRPEPILLVPLAGMSLLLLGGLYYFRRVEATFADIV